jgi:fructokinase
VPTELLAGVELGGTKCVCVLGTGPRHVHEQVRIVTRGPEQTLSEIEAVLDDWRTRHGSIAALGIASFGPIDLDRSSPTFGYIRATTKPGWHSTDLAMRLARRVRAPMQVDTDVNAAALAEGEWGAARGLTDFAYVTVGTGVGVGLITAGRPIVGFAHAEAGHIRVARMPGDTWTGHCTFHGDCVEGLASGPAIEVRTGVRAERLAADHPVWDSVAQALAQLLHALVLLATPRRIIVGGGVMTAQEHLYARIRTALQRSLGSYLDAKELEGGLDGYLVAPGLGTSAGPLGALLLASKALGGGSIVSNDS